MTFKDQSSVSQIVLKLVLKSSTFNPIIDTYLVKMIANLISMYCGDISMKCDIPSVYQYFLL